MSHHEGRFARLKSRSFRSRLSIRRSLGGGELSDKRLDLIQLGLLVQLLLGRVEALFALADGDVLVRHAHGEHNRRFHIGVSLQADEAAAAQVS